jgi:hypothetical protein
MFGRRWKSGQATVVARRYVTAPGDQAFEYIVDVQPDDGSPLYRATFRHNARDPRAPKEAAVITVFCDIRKQDVKVDYNALEAAYRAAHNPTTQPGTLPSRHPPAPRHPTPSVARWPTSPRNKLPNPAGLLSWWLPRLHR